MADELTIDTSRMKMQINGSLRGDKELELPVLVNPEDTVTMLDRSYLGELVTGFGLVERKGPFPPSYKAIQEIASDYPGDCFEIYELINDHHIALSEKWLKQAIRFLAGSGQFDAGEFKIYHPSGSTGAAAGPFAIVTSHTPEEFVIHRLFESKTQFLNEFGAGACPECEKKFSSHFVNCPDCGQRPESVQQNIELLQEEHDGVVAMIAPIVDFSPTTRHELDEGNVDIRRPLEEPEPEIDVIESPGLQEGA